MGMVADNVLKHGTGALNIDGCRVVTDENLNGGAYLGWNGKSRRDDLPEAGMFVPGKHTEDVFRQPEGRWPANVIHDGSDEVIELFPDARGQIAASVDDGSEQHNSVYGKLKHGGPKHVPRQDTSKSAARFFYCAKTSKSERGKGNNHPTVKPLALMQYLVRLVTPPSSVVLDPFAGSGTTLLAAQAEGFKSIGIEQSEEYCDIILNRIAERIA